MASPIKLTPRLQKLLTDKMQADKDTEGAATFVDPVDATYQREVATKGIEEARRRGVPVELFSPGANAGKFELREPMPAYFAADDSPQSFDFGRSNAYESDRKQSMMEVAHARAMQRDRFDEEMGKKYGRDADRKSAFLRLIEDVGDVEGKLGPGNDAVSLGDIIRRGGMRGTPIAPLLPGESTSDLQSHLQRMGYSPKYIAEKLKEQPEAPAASALPNTPAGSTPTAAYTPTRMTGESQWTEEDFDYEPSLNARVTVAKAKYQAAVELLGLRRQLEEPVSWSKSSGSATSRTHNPMGALELGGKMENDVARTAMAMLEARKKEQRDLGERRVIIRGQQYDTTGTVAEAEKMRAKAALGAQLRNIADDLKALKATDPDFSGKRDNLIDYASATISAGLSQGVLTDADAARKAQQLATDRIQFVFKGGPAVLRNMADSIDKNVIADIAQRSGRRVTGGRLWLSQKPRFMSRIPPQGSCALPRVLTTCARHSALASWSPRSSPTSAPCRSRWAARSRMRPPRKPKSSSWRGEGRSPPGVIVPVRMTRRYTTLLQQAC